MQQLQRLFFKHVPKLRELALSNCGTLEKREVLKRELAQLAPEELRFLVTRQLRCVGAGSGELVGVLGGAGAAAAAGKDGRGRAAEDRGKTTYTCRRWVQCCGAAARCWCCAGSRSANPHFAAPWLAGW